MHNFRLKRLDWASIRVVLVILVEQHVLIVLKFGNHLLVYIEVIGKFHAMLAHKLHADHNRLIYSNVGNSLIRTTYLSISVYHLHKCMNYSLFHRVVRLDFRQRLHYMAIKMWYSNKRKMDRTKLKYMIRKLLAKDVISMKEFK